MATSLGAVLALHPYFVVLALVVFAAGVACLRSVGLSACLAAIAIGLLGLFAPMDPPVLAGRAWCVLIALVVLSRHRSNLIGWLAQH